MRRLIGLVLALAFMAQPVLAQNVSTYRDSAGHSQAVDPDHPLPVTSTSQDTANASLTAILAALPGTNVSAAVSVNSATTTQIVAASGTTAIHLKNWILVTTLANNVTWESGDSGGSCANPVPLTGAMPFTANGGAAVGDGFGDVLIAPAGKALCLLTSAATQISGSVSYRQF